MQQELAHMPGRRCGCGLPLAGDLAQCFDCAFLADMDELRDSLLKSVQAAEHIKARVERSPRARGLRLYYAGLRGFLRAVDAARDRMVERYDSRVAKHEGPAGPT